MSLDPVHHDVDAHLHPTSGMNPVLAKMLDLKFFHDNGWMRRICPTCKDPFWTLDKATVLCGDSNCVEYDFIGKPLTTKPLSLAQMRQAFLKFFESKGHKVVPRYPVVARWRDDIYLNIASIANFQPHTTSGEVPPPANPLVVSQPCIRLNDLANIGRSGRHFSTFEMMGHHAFNSKAWGEKYWTEECLAYGVEFLTKTLGLDGMRITFKESTWNGGGNAGPCVEVFAGGLEVATLVFMCLEECDPKSVPAGTQTYVIKGETYRMMELRIIDTGWGLERLAWASTGTPTAYDTVFPETLAHLKSLATVKVRDDEQAQRIIAEHARVQGVLNLDVGQKLDALRGEVVKRLAARGITSTVEELQAIMAPVEAVYALADHLRCLSFMVGDGIVPSNVKAGYLMRLVTRRALRFKDILGIPQGLDELLAWNLERMTAEFPEFKAAIPRAREIAKLETERFAIVRARGQRIVEQWLQPHRQQFAATLAVVNTDIVNSIMRVSGEIPWLKWHDEHGLDPGFVQEIAREFFRKDLLRQLSGTPAAVNVEVVLQGIAPPDDFDLQLAALHSKEKKGKDQGLGLTVAPTELLYYTDQAKRSFTATVLWAGRVDGKPACVLDKTCFFAETGGQPGDQGVLRTMNGRDIKVLTTRKDGPHAVHVVSEPLDLHAQVHGEVDWDLRMDHTRSHTATHIMNQAVRRVLGPHSWQAGTQKYADCARVDMTHFRRPTREELAQVEQLANQVVMDGRKVSRTWYKREEAEAKFGLTLLQGGIPKGRDVRVVMIGPVPSQDPTSGWGESSGPGTADPWFDVEYCGGTHCETTAEVGPVKLYRTERVQDGVERFEYSAGLHAVAKWQGTDEVLRAAGEAMEVQPSEVPKAAARFFGEWKEQRKSIDTMQARLAELESKAAAANAQSVNGVKLVVSILPGAALQKTATELVAQPKTVALLGSTDGAPRLVFARSPDVAVDVGALLKEAIGMIGGRGGGKPDFAQGGGQDASKVNDALATAKGKLMALL